MFCIFAPSWIIIIINFTEHCTSEVGIHMTNNFSDFQNLSEPGSLLIYMNNNPSPTSSDPYVSWIIQATF